MFCGVDGEENAHLVNPELATIGPIRINTILVIANKSV
jgi:hypothetical protein